jgi:hypothetical protein
MANFNPDLWALSQIPQILNDIDVSASCFRDALGDFPDTPDAEDLQLVMERKEGREERYGEVVDQSGSFEHYYYSVLSISAHAQPNTAKLISLGVAVAGMVGMYWKSVHMRARPAHVLPGLFPLVPTPAHPSFPSNHATQSYTVTRLLSHAVKDQKSEQFRLPLRELATRISENREYAGLHFTSDTKGGRKLSKEVCKALLDADVVKDELIPAVRAELNALIA